MKSGQKLAKKIILRVFQVLVVALLVAGVVIRSGYYLLARPLQGDECSLAQNIFETKNLAGFFRPLSYQQAAPSGFMMLSALAFYSFSPYAAELSFRLLPFLSSLGGLWLFYLLAKKVLKSKPAILLALLLMAFNFNLAEYAQWFKQYSSDGLIFLAILLSIFYLKVQEWSKFKLVLLGVVYALCIWLSYPSVVAIATVLIILLIKKTKIKNLIFLALPVVISGVGFLISQRVTVQDNHLHDYWQSGFIAVNFSNLPALMKNLLLWQFSLWGRDIWVLLIAGLLVLGLLITLKRIKEDASAVLVLPFLLALVLSYARIYPLEARLSLYLIPIIILLACRSFDVPTQKWRDWHFLLTLPAGITLCLLTMGITSWNWPATKRLPETENAPQLLAAAAASMEEEAVLYVPFDQSINFIFYDNLYRMQTGKDRFENVWLESGYVANTYYYGEVHLDKMLEILDALPPGIYYYFLATFYNQKAAVLQLLIDWAATKTDYRVVYTDDFSNGLIKFVISEEEVLTEE